MKHRSSSRRTRLSSLQTSTRSQARQRVDRVRGLYELESDIDRAGLKRQMDLAGMASGFLDDLLDLRAMLEEQT